MTENSDLEQSIDEGPRRGNHLDQFLYSWASSSPRRLARWRRRSQRSGRGRLKVIAISMLSILIVAAFLVTSPASPVSTHVRKTWTDFAGGSYCTGQPTQAVSKSPPDRVA